MLHTESRRLIDGALADCEAAVNALDRITHEQLVQDPANVQDLLTDIAGWIRSSQQCLTQVLVIEIGGGGS